ncbi:MAG: SDR family NAD(P)-dependent oxidoreductase [Burkholderiales bacterium]|nr:MAG: SDR family NAD(P)-dependent oxidoreductase [Burkholderiales bacterium]
MTARIRTWLITGCSTGFGRALAQLLIGKGERVLATARNLNDLDGLVAGHDNARAFKLDVTDSDAIMALVSEVGEIDILVNNAGYGYLCAVEEGDEEGYRAQFETNLFGLIAMTKAVLPQMRQRGSGHIVNIASIGGLLANPGTGYYAASKFGVVGFSEALAKEVGGLGVRVTVIEPGAFRTEWAGRSLRTSTDRIAAYADTVHARLDQIAAHNESRPGDPIRAAEAIVSVVDSDEPPLNLVLGVAGLAAVREKIAALSAELDRWEAVSLNADYSEGA